MQNNVGEWLQSFLQVFECNPMTECLVLKKYVQSFHIIQTILFFWCVVMGMGKKKNQKKA